MEKNKIEEFTQGIKKETYWITSYINLKIGQNPLSKRHKNFDKIPELKRQINQGLYRFSLQ